MALAKSIPNTIPSSCLVPEHGRGPLTPNAKMAQQLKMLRESTRSKVPPGNWLARQLRCLQDDSKGKVIPLSRGSKRSYIKYSSLYGVDFCNLDNDLLIQYWAQKLQDEQEQAKIEEARETVADVFGGRTKPQRPEQMFANWKIPPRVLDKDTKVKDVPLARKSQTPRPASKNVKSSSQQKLVSKSCSAIEHKVPMKLPELPQATQPQVMDRPPCRQAPRNLPSVVERPATTQLGKPSQHMSGLGLRKEISNLERRLSIAHDDSAIGTGNRILASQPPAKLKRSRSMSPRKLGRARSSLMGQQALPNTVVNPQETNRITKQEMEHSFQPHILERAEEWMKQAPQVERHVVEKILGIVERKYQVDHAMKKTLLPDAVTEVNKWMEAATDKEREVAQLFFSSLSGTKLMGTTTTEQKARLQQVLRALENGKHPGNGSECTLKSEETDSDKGHGLRYIRLLSSRERENRWMQTTWHHLPEYKDANPVTNWSSMYNRPHDISPRHFVIHPDWG